MGTVAIIGSGPAGIVAAKTAVEYGLIPTILEKSSQPGGIWQPTKGSTWERMRTNISHYTCMFSDFAWKGSVQDFPNQREVFEYLGEYMKTFKLEQYLNLNSNVETVLKVGNRWLVEWRKDDLHKRSQCFSYVIVATGIFSKAAMPFSIGIENFKERVTHAKDYKTAETFGGKEVVVIGSAFSGCEIAAELTSTAKRIVHATSRKSMYILPRHLPAKDSTRKVPADLVFYSLAAHLRSKDTPPEEVNQRKHNWLRSVSQQEKLPPELQVTTEMKNPPYVVISDSYVQRVDEKRIEIKHTRIEYIMDEETVLFTDGTQIRADEIICCTGYKTELPFLDPETLDDIEFVPDDPFQPMLLHKTVFARNNRGLAFVGLYRGPFFGVMELQARYACSAFSGKIPLPTQEEIESGIKEEQKIRNMKPRPQFPHGDYVGLCEDLAKQIGAAPDLEALRTSNPPLHKQLLEGPFTVASYRLSGFGSKPDLALRMIEQINRAATGTAQ